jgi:hypothetical protein
MTRIVTTTYRYKRPPRKQKRVALEAPVIVTTKSSRRPPVKGTEEAAAEASEPPAITTTGQRAQPSTPHEAARVAPPANDDRKPAIFTARKPKRGNDDAPGLRPEELQRRGEAAEALWRELVRRATTK